MNRAALLSVAVLMSVSLSGTHVDAQVAGTKTLSVLQLPTSPRVAALGVDVASVYSPADMSVGFGNPSLIGNEYARRLALSYTGLFGGSGYGSVAYGLNTKRFGVILLGLHFFNYGTFDAYDEYDVDQGSFFAADYALSAGWALNIDSNFAIGASLKPVLSQYESYNALAFSLDVSASFMSDDKRFALSLVARNIGAQVSTFNGKFEHIPFNLLLTMSYKLSNAPFLFFVQADELTHWKLKYDDPLNSDIDVDPYTGEEVQKSWLDGALDVVDHVARHVAFGIELDINNHIFARVGYRFRQTAEMASSERTNINLSGFSYGVGFRTKKFEFTFSRRNYHLGQAPNSIGLSFKL